MSSSSHNLNSFPYFPSTSYNLPLTLPSLPNYDPSGNNTIFNIHQTHQDPVSFLAPYFPVSSHYSQFSAPENVINLAVSNNIQTLGNIPDLLTKTTPAAKKDRHSKIYTAQGLRDRRVRLSIDIARKFFDLQDMLGYDKASKTLEWLLSKSRKSIKELSRAKHESAGVHGAKKVSFVSDIENPEEEEEDEGLGQKSKSQLSIDEDGDMEGKVSKVEMFHVLAKESRVQARERARERTMEAKKFSGDEEICNQKSEEISNHWNWKHLNQSETSNPAPDSYKSIEESSMIKRKSAKKFIDDTKMSLHDSTEISQWKFLDQIKTSKGLLEEPSIMKRKLKPSVISGSSQRNLVFSIDSIPINYLAQSWDINDSSNYPLSK